MGSEIDFLFGKKKHTIDVVDLFFKSAMSAVLSDEDQEKLYSASLPFIFVENASIIDMIGVVMSDTSRVIMFCKELSQKTNSSKKVRCAYSISSSKIMFIHYESGTILENSISELSEFEPDLISSECTFTVDRKVKDISFIDNSTISINGVKIENKITDLVKNSNKYKNVLGYYIPRDSYDKINVFMTSKQSFESSDFSDDVLEKIDSEDANPKKIVKTLISSSNEYMVELKKQCSKKSSQIVAFNIARLIVECLFPILIDEEEFIEE